MIKRNRYKRNLEYSDLYDIPNLDMNELYILIWHFKRTRRLWSNFFETKKVSKFIWSTTSAIPNSKDVKVRLEQIIDKSGKLPSTKRGLAKYLNKLLKEAGLDKNWIIYY